MFNSQTGLWHQTGEAPYYRLLAIDPDTTTLGLSVLGCDFTTGKITLLYATTLDASKTRKRYHLTSSVHGDRFARLKALENSLLCIMNDFEVHGIVSECPYLGRFPTAFEALTESLCAIRSAVLAYDVLLPLHEIEPSVVKMNVNVNGKSNDKDLMRVAINELVKSSRIVNYGGVNIDKLDQHAIDSIAVGYSHYRTLLQ